MSSHRFTDADNREWDLEISLAAAMRIDSCDFSELIPGEKFSFLEPPPRFFELLLEKTSLQFAVIWCIVQPRAIEQELTQDSFCEAIKPVHLTPAKTALWGAVADFFPHLRTSLVRLAEIHGKNLIRVDRKLEQMGDTIEQLNNEELDKALGALDQEVRELFAKRGTTSTDSPRMPASPTGSPSP